MHYWLKTADLHCNIILLIRERKREGKREREKERKSERERERKKEKAREIK